MTAKEWLEILKQNIKILPKNERTSVVSYYSEMIADGLESGVSEEEFIKTLGNPHDVTKKILAENGVKYTQSENSNEQQSASQTEPSKKRTPLWVLIILGFFVLSVVFPIFIAGLTTLLCLFVTFWACFGAFVISAFACVIGIFIAIVMAIVGTVQSGWALVGASILATGVITLLAVGFWFISIYTTKLVEFIFKKLKGGKHV